MPSSSARGRTGSRRRSCCCRPASRSRCARRPAHIGGGLHTEELTLPGFRHDVCASVLPLALGSPFFRYARPAGRLGASGARRPRTRSTTGRRSCSSARSTRRSSSSAATAPPTGSWSSRSSRTGTSSRRRCSAGSRRRLAAALRALRAAGLAGARAALGDARSVAESLFETERARAWFAGHCAHSMLPLERRPSAGFGLALAVLGHAVGWPVARGGGSTLADALAERVRELGGTLVTGSPVDELPQRPARAGRRVAARARPSRAAAVCPRVTSAACAATATARAPSRSTGRSTARSPGAPRSAAGPAPSTSAERSTRSRTRSGARGAAAPVERPFVLLVQQSLFDDTRAPAGKHSAWAYCHVPNGSDADHDGADRGTGRALRARLRRAGAGTEHDRPGRAPGAQSQPGRRRPERRRDGPRPALPPADRLVRMRRRSTASSSARPRRHRAAASMACAAIGRLGPRLRLRDDPRRRLGHDLRARHGGRDARAGSRDVRLRSLCEPGRARGRALAARGPAPAARPFAARRARRRR